MSEYIKLEDVLKVIENGYCFVPEATWAIRNIPAIDIVRCKECKHYVAETDSGDGREWSSCEYWLREINDDDFCSRGERGDNEQS